MYKILFIDEQQEDIDDFMDYIDATKTENNVEVVAEFPLETLDEMIQVIFKHNPDAVITDFMLNEYKEIVKYNVPYNGVDLVKELLSIRQGFPCFVMTALDDDAINVSNDVNIVYIKNILHGSEKNTKAKANFLERVESQIMHYTSEIQEAEKRICHLIELRNTGQATLEDENEIIHLDHILENSIDKRCSIPEQYKTLSNTKRLENILSKVDELLNKIENTDGK